MNIIRVFVFAILCSMQGYAQSADSLASLVVQLQQKPEDDTLRQKVIRRAREMKPEPDMPNAALQHENNGYALFGNGNSPQHFFAAAREYEQALGLAPWVARLYLRLGEIYEKMSDTAVADQLPATQPRQSCSEETRSKERKLFSGYDRARRNFESYLLAEVKLGKQDVAIVKQRIARGQLKLASWHYQWNDQCCAGCGGKQGSAG